MNKYSAFLIAFLFLAFAGKTFAAPVAKTKFQSDLDALLVAANTTMGFDSLKGVEIASNEWTCRQELDGFITTIREKEYDPRAVLYVSARSVRPVAYKYASMLGAKGLHGYKCRDSNTDKTVPIDATTQARKLVFSRREKYVSVIVTVIFIAHEDNSVLLTVETR